MTRDEYNVWRLEMKLVEDLLRQIEQSERVILAALGCPSDPVEIFRILNGERKAPWRKKTSARDKTRALHAMHALVQVASVRAHMRLGKENARLAAHAALLAGMLADNARLKTAVADTSKRTARSGGLSRGAQIARTATARDHVIAKHHTRWQSSDELQDQYPSPVTYIREKTQIHPRTLQRRLGKITTTARQ